MKIQPISLFFLCIISAFFASCANQKPADLAKIDKTSEGYENPFEPGSYDHFRAEKKYPKTFDSWTNIQLLPQTNASNSWVRVELEKQRAQLMNGDQVVIDYRITSGTKDRPTPPGEYKVLEKIVDKKSNLYGKIYDAEGKLVKSNADSLKDEIPEGGEFVGAGMKYWMRLTWDGIGHHIGPLRSYPASHACIRGPRKTMPIVYSKMKVGSKIVVQ